MVVPSTGKSSSLGACLQKLLRLAFLRSRLQIFFVSLFILVVLPVVFESQLVTLSDNLAIEKNGTMWQNKTDQSPAFLDTAPVESFHAQPTIKASDLPDASNWAPTDDTPFEVCFVTAVYSQSAQYSDRPPDVNDIKAENPSFRFFAFSNLQDLDAPGWTLVVKEFPDYRRFITQSRWPKFMGWKDNSVYGCQAVFYMDGFCSPKAKHSERYKRLAKAIRDSKFGLFQNLHESAVGPLDELQRIVERNKDIPKNVEASKSWLLAQPDFRPNATMYANHYIGYDPKNKEFKRAAEFFWNRYSLELDSWRDQPLWSYVLDRFHITPTRLGTFEALFKEHYKRMGHAGHRYNEKADSNALPLG